MARDRDPRVTWSRYTRPAASEAPASISKRQSPSPVGSSPPSSSAIPSALRADARNRLGVVSLLLGAAVALVVGADFVLVYGLGAAAHHCGMTLVGITGAALVLLSFGMFALARGDRLTPRRVLDLGLVYEVVVALGIALASYFDNPAALGHATSLWLCLWIVLFPLIVPGTRRKIAAASLAAASTGPAVLALVAFRHPGLVDAGRAAVTLLPYYVCAALALVPTELVRRLGASVSRAEKKARELGSYRLTELLGKGGMGEVWKAEHRMLARPAAIKLVQLDALDGQSVESREKTLRRFEQEARATASLRSPHTVSVYDFGVTDAGSFYYVMELLDGLDLDSLVTRFGPVTPARAVHLLLQICDSLAEAHLAGMVHRDVKPANIYLTRLGLQHDFAKVLDFGLATRAHGCQCPDRSKLTDANTIVGTPAFMAPEMAAGREDVDGRADIYALGAVAYWLLTGTHVFDGSERTPMEVLVAHMHTAPEPPSLRASQPIPEGLENLILQCLEKDPANRPASASELKRYLEALELDDVWSDAHARRWWSKNLGELAVVEPESADETRLAPVRAA